MLLVTYFRTWAIFGDKLYEWLADRENLGVWLRVLLWFAGLILYAIAVFALALGSLIIASSLISNVT